MSTVNKTYIFDSISGNTGGINTDDFVTGATFNTNTGDLISIRLSGGTIITNLDGRYALSGDSGSSAASATTFNPYLTLTSIEVQSAIEELKDEVDLLNISGATGINTDDFLTGATFNTTDGDLSLNLQSGSTVTVNLDDRYFVSGPETFSCDTVSNTVSYIGYGDVGACKISKVETISGYTYTAFWSEGVEDLDKIWANRLSYGYF